MDYKPVYKNNFETAVKNNETALYHESVHMNRECAESIDKAVSGSNYELNHYDLKNAANAVIDEYGPERVSYVLANILQKQEWDKRFSPTNMGWALGVGTNADERNWCNTHPAVLDGFVNRVREVMAQREKETFPSILLKKRRHQRQNRLACFSRYRIHFATGHGSDYRAQRTDWLLYFS